MARTHEEREKALKVAESKNVVDVAQSLGMDLVKSGRNYTWSEHDSFVFNTRKNLFYWNSRQKGGGAIQLVQIIKGCNYGEAVKYLNNVDVGTFEEVEIEKKEPFKYFMKEHTKMSATMDYLIGERKLSKDTVDFFISKGILAQSTWKDKESGKTEPVIVFKHTDLEGNIRGVSLQGIWENKEMHGSRGRLKKTFGDGFYGMNVRIGNPPSVREATSEKPIKIIAFESPIDLMSYYELHKSSIGDAILLSMNGLRKGTISTYVVNELGLKVDENKKSTMLDVMNNLYQPIDIIQIVLAVDNDEFNPKLGFKPGQNFVDTFDVDFIPVKSGIPELLPGKKKTDWNDHVKDQKAKQMGKRGEKQLMDKRLNKEHVHVNSYDVTSEKADNDFVEQTNSLSAFDFSDFEDEGLELTEDLNKAIYIFEDGSLWSGFSEGGGNIRDIDHGIVEAFMTDQSMTRTNPEFWSHVLNELIQIVPESKTVLCLEGVEYSKEQEVRLEEYVSNGYEVQLLENMITKKERTEEVVIEKEKSESVDIADKKEEGKLKKVVSDNTKTIVVSNNYLQGLIDVLEDSVDTMEAKDNPKHYLTEEQIQQILNDHFVKVEQLVANFQTSYDLLKEPTKVEAAQLKNGLIETVESANDDVKRSLSDALAETKQLAITNVKEKASELRRFVKNSFNKPILALNSKIRGFVETIDRKFALETAEGKVELGSEETEIVPEQIENEPQQQSSVLIKEVQEYIALNAAKESLLAQIQKEIQDNPLAKIDTLQRTLEENQRAIKNVEQRIEAVTPSMINQQDQEAKGETLNELSNLVKEKERLEAERNQIVQEPDFLRKEGSLDSFKQVDQQLNDVNERLMKMEEATQKSQEKESKIEPLVVGAAVADQVVKNKENQNDTLKSALTSQDTAAINSQLKSNMAEYFDPKNVKTYLDSASKFHNYSPKNVQLIMEQDPKATQVANENKWNQLGYELREDAKPIQIYQPVFVPIRDEEGRVKFKENNQPETEVEFQLKPVFDVSQTTAGHLKAPTQYDLTKDDQFMTVYKTIEDMSDTKVELQPLGNLNSHYDSKNRTVIVNEGLGKKETIQALLNEVLPLYNAENEKVKNENTLNVFEQEAAAYMIASHVGLDTSGFTFASLSQLKEEGYSLEDFTRSLTDSSKNATEIINSIDKNYEKSKKTSKTKNKFDERLSQANTKNKETMEQFQLKDQSVEKSASLRR
ncbi:MULTISPECIES: DUF3991 domain-containing protein [unclassified Enterococcus]|uniref:DUF3991 domain-containing protein n=1 Tax=unclassified Enterococcus TaxID=2608891 RepID=UPI001CE128E1|nr:MULTISPECIES: DUF3991 domain-containing protein [unclassified Enterococcus]MCA5014565.1 DUF3991 domain-containing protein [Enterococcus sp. S23]MCA5017818.1 DUF3991 domain-containing protein [Enterococcus sp. S22(2020)]